MFYICVWSHHQVAFHQHTALWEPSSGRSHHSATALTPLSAPYPWMDPACSPSATWHEKVKMRWAICLLVRRWDPSYLLRAYEIRDAIDVLRCSYHRPWSEMTLFIHTFSPAYWWNQNFLLLSPVSGKPLDKRIFQTHHFLLWIKL